MIRFQKQYGLLTILLFCIEVIIALFFHDRFIRPHFGDLVVVILIYCFIKTFFNTPVVKTALAVLVFAYLIELSQYFNLVGRLGLQNSRVANLILGNLFQWIDLVAYTLGIVLIIIAEKIKESLYSEK
jgi:DNA integrity scanning protein DisA with diadenylate cyclase activity